MAQFIINLDSISTENSKKDIMAYLESKPDYAKWKDFYSSGAGQTVIELISGLSAFISSNVIMSRREVYLPYAQTLSANIGIASTLGYSVFRGRNSRIKVSITPDITEVLPKYTIIGSVLDVDLILLNDSVLSNGTPTELECTLGEIKSEELSVSSSDMQTFRFYDQSVSEDLRIFVNTTEVEYTNSIADLSVDKYVVISNAFGSFDLFYLNNVAPKYNTGDILKAEYIKLNSVTFQPSDVSVDYTGVTNIEIQDPYSEQETISSIKVNAPLKHETQGLIKGREDYPKLLMSLDSDFIDTEGNDYSPAIVEVSYIKNDLSLLNNTEKLNINTALLESRPFGVAPAKIVDPVNVQLDINIHIKLLTSTTESVNDFVESIVASNEKKLKYIFDMDLMENSIEQKDYIKTARVSVDAPIWQSDSLYSRLDYVSPTTTSDLIFEMHKDIRKSGISEPLWTDTIDEIIQDNDIFWKCIIDDRCFFDSWVADTNYDIGTIISPTGLTNKYIVYKRNNLSDSIEPTFPAILGEDIIDNEVVWKCIAIQGVPITWLPNNNYSIGSIVIPSTPDGFAYQVISYNSKSGNIEPTWPIEGETVVDGKVLWKAINKYDTSLTTNWNEYLIINQNLTIA